MKYSNIQKQQNEIITIFKQDHELIAILTYLSEIELPHFYIIAGAVFQTIWNYYDHNPLHFKNKDIDIIYYDQNHLEKEDEEALKRKITDHFELLGLHYTFDIHNEARMHLWKKENENQQLRYIEHAEEAIGSLIATVQAIGITLDKGVINIYAPYGFSDIFSKTIRPIKQIGNTKERYEKKVASWQKKFSNLTVIEW